MTPREDGSQSTATWQILADRKLPARLQPMCCPLSPTEILISGGFKGPDGESSDEPDSDVKPVRDCKIFDITNQTFRTIRGHGENLIPVFAHSAEYGVVV
eukprot:CAMPEP_0185568000 /NCGR_PEP_ID=MMETSP0434-20130131/1099_1 /TAXON_ID=626734 ORGANISM="Favella taraikaensis, Strain Fe Narragansett Bay" /NCGR_SAMPLE_ID=MMETSP0434 /ASSEMBLY_ACC=CAM_ASM_000379 /LENGTH=99 /DNA_ID=CAMNT_0028182377 /DNA_START=793 /DNA_END=1092 /DNA_ORIENTATION=-